MQSKSAIAIILSILTVIGAMLLNFREFSMGSPATIANLIVTSVYIAAWIIVLVISAKSANRNPLRLFLVFWVITLLLAILTAYVNVSGAEVDWALPFALLVMGQWYGLNLLVGSFLTASIIIAIISLTMSIAVSLALRRAR